MPRGITLDTRGNLLVVERGRGLTGHTLDANGCVTSSKVVIQDTQINHGIDVHPSGRRIIASSGDIAWSWDYDPATMTATNRRTLVTGMNNFYHFTRTVHISRKYPNLFALNVGSDGNIDVPTRQQNSGRAQIRVFDYDQLPQNGVPFVSQYGRVLGYGLRNDVGITEDRAGNIHSIENSLDNAYRMVNGQRRDIHTNNPAEKVYNLGDPSNPRAIFGGYPDCYTVWEPSDFTDSPKQPGDWFTQDNSGQYTDAWCNANAVKPTLLLPPHTAPLDMKFGLGNDTNLYVALHGSWNRQPPQGYKVVVVPGQYSASGEWSPTAPLAQSRTAWSDLLTNRNENQCSGFGNANCFRPVGLVWSADGQNLYVSSDTSGEVFIIKRMSGPIVQPPITQPPITTSPPTPTTPPVVQPPTTVAPPQASQTLWGQCGGQGWTGPTLCPANSVCRESNQWYSHVPACATSSERGAHVLHGEPSHAIQLHLTDPRRKDQWIFTGYYSKFFRNHITGIALLIPAAPILDMEESFAWQTHGFSSNSG
ncbi:cellobiose dehydrogenase [Coprinopsis cinerea AmutBmut pab1-1]|nr:cellobiose dehydrogenase [Coprinopsis cinerea AmutBmut pab1-1]